MEQMESNKQEGSDKLAHLSKKMDQYRVEIRKESVREILELKRTNRSRMTAGPDKNTSLKAMTSQQVRSILMFS
jgi:hypothetical protein